VASPLPYGVQVTAVMKVFLVVVVVLVATLLSDASGRAVVPSRIVFIADRAPSLSGEIYRLDPDGRLVDLSNSPFQDSGPVISPDGQRVAFFSDRGGAVSVWEAGIDGRGLVQVGPSSTSQQNDFAASLAWQPGGNRLASVEGDTLFMLQPGQAPLPVLAGKNGVGLGPWSPDGSILVVWDYAPQLVAIGVAHALSPDGSQLWSVSGVDSPYWAGWSGDTTQSWSWSRGGLVALPVGLPHPTLRVYDESGHLRFAVHGTSGRPGWSPDGKLLAVVVGKHAEVFTAAGRRILRSRSGISRPMCRQVVWASNKRFIVGGFAPHVPKNPCGAFSVAVHNRKVSTASRLWFGTPLSADRKLVAVAAQSGNQIAIGVTSTAGNAATTYGQVTACAPNLWPAPVSSLQFVGPSRSLVYTSYCPVPPKLLYSVAPDGNDLQQLATPAQLQQPTLSPDGTRIAFSSTNGYGGIGVLNSDGTQDQLTSPPTACTAPGGEKIPYQDTSPSWSPDGTAIVFTRTGCGGNSELYTVPVGSGGAVHNLGLAGDQAAWGPSKIAYIADGVWTANPDGTDPTQVASNGRDPAWSSAGRLAYLTGSTTAVVDSTPTQLPFTDVTSLAWSPDGARFAVTASTPTDPFDVYSVNIDGTDPIQLTPNYDALDLAGWR
jgi:Tol biopolymer transport system component